MKECLLQLIRFSIDLITLKMFDNPLYRINLYRKLVASNAGRACVFICLTWMFF